MTKYKPTIGLEIHAELKTNTKMFCDSKNDPDETKPNVNICPVCMAHPGTLPVINKQAVKSVLKVGVALNGNLADFTEFDRKNYFYPDIPKGYQISQYKYPLVSGGNLKGVDITRIHLEEDTARSTHDDAGHSLVDYNRAGIPLMELVTEPVIVDAKQAATFAKELQILLRYLGVGEANMEKGEMRIEANISVAPCNTYCSNLERIETNNNEYNVARSNGQQIVLKDESFKIMGLLFEVHNKLGSVYKEKNYQDAIEAILKRENIQYEREKQIDVKLDDIKISDIFVDFVVDKKILLEVKATKFITQEDIRQTLRYIKSANLPLGIIVNFKKDKLEYKRLINSKYSGSFDLNSGEVPKAPLGTKVEVKNLNSFKVVEKAIDYEIKRQIKVIEDGGKIIQETRGWDDNKQKTFSQRLKEGSEDYRYFPDPDLPKLQISEIEEFKKEVLEGELPELPWQKRERYGKEFGIKDEDIEMYISNELYGKFFEEVVKNLRDLNLTDGQSKNLIKLASNYITSDLTGLKKNGTTDGIGQLNENNFSQLIKMVGDGEVSSRGAKDILKIIFEEGGEAKEVAVKNNLIQKSDKNELEKVVKIVIEQNKEVVNDYKNGKETALKYLLGQSMRESKGSANPVVLEEVLKELLQ